MKGLGQRVVEELRRRPRRLETFAQQLIRQLTDHLIAIHPHDDQEDKNANGDPNHDPCPQAPGRGQSAEGIPHQPPPLRGAHAGHKAPASGSACLPHRSIRAGQDLLEGYLCISIDQPPPLNKSDGGLVSRRSVILSPYRIYESVTLRRCRFRQMSSMIMRRHG